MEPITQDPCKQVTHRLEAVADILGAVNREVRSNTGYYILLDHIRTQLTIDAVALHVTNHRLQLTNIARLGFRFGDNLESLINRTEGLAYAVLNAKKAIQYNMSIANTASESFVSFLNEEGFYDYLGIPLTEGHQLLGVLELFSHTPMNITADWKLHLRFIHSIASNTIQRKTQLYKQDTTTAELEVAYSETLEAWVRALEIRDNCTAGHTHRVLEMTLRLASLMGVPNEMLVHISPRGAAARHRQAGGLGYHPAQNRPSRPPGVAGNAGTSQVRL